ncbi:MULTISPECIES: hypothetical protein [Sphingobium]|uniref:Uncharacterized protein n=1 Tax=Sphingobium chungbukense TaxID=56193 RepID=A0A0M3ATZ4_9SPHN|nr:MULTISPECIES: hypothetical protein [Sphingobium]KKW92411.1 hypothetical protein YP76_10925 [Sphingobium chungbukense]PJG48723.1 hypothetical protein CAF53_11110 [Sphingobium sp. LB126]
MDQPDKNRLPDMDEENSEQADAGSQAQDVAEDARLRSTDRAEDSERGGRPNPAQIIPDDTPDLVEKMEEMNRSGRIDTDAFAGEPQMDDEEDSLGPTEDED